MVKIHAHILIGEKVAEMISKKNAGLPVTSYFDSILGIPATAHILSRCSIEKDEKAGVIDEFSIPSSSGVNSSLIITKMAEYAMILIPKKG